MTNPLLSIEDVKVVYKIPGGRQITAVKGVSLQMQPATVLGLVGESGCGKSTLARAVCGLEKIESGQIRFKGIPVTPLGMRKRPEELLRVQMVFQNPYASLNPRRTIGSQIADGLRVNPHKDSWTVADLLAQVELPSAVQSRYPHQFSGGQRQRIAIARAIAAGPELLIGDEPIASLDASLQAKVATLMRKLALESGASLLFISHDLAVVRIIADEIAVMQRGELVETGTAAAVWEQPQAAYTQRLLAAIPAVDGMGTLPGHEIVEVAR
ncbi:ABC transporter ATP-binding protein [Leucobacter sp. OH2974_COT-288]|uniref:Peptide/nickel transport system ATP-binding protein n=1 Tax=Canibacter oris TaxID=1365628 RepID=A0A840DJD1_9MICO|nr:ATP-binding cassette domain-containing protein [Canibacter oris]MBB4071823.1 peptide/nickel transport system ATP-binding protein [Canibacter oris]RRD35393.1 ABC transporter ATP-binding protein [Leucobacter sp. OH2974_COT-288]